MASLKQQNKQQTTYPPETIWSMGPTTPKVQPACCCRQARSDCLRGESPSGGNLAEAHCATWPRFLAVLPGPAAADSLSARHFGHDGLLGLAALAGRAVGRRRRGGEAAGGAARRGCPVQQVPAGGWGRGKLFQTHPLEKAWCRQALTKVLECACRCGRWGGLEHRRGPRQVFGPLRERSINKPHRGAPQLGEARRNSGPAHKAE